MEIQVAQIPEGNYREFELVVAMARALNEHFQEFASDKRLTNARLTALEADVKAMNEKLDQVLGLLGPQAVPKRDLRKPAQGGQP